MRVFGGTKKDDIILNFNKKLASIEFLEKIREESDYMVEMTALDSYLNHAKLAAANFLPKNLNPNSWNFGLEFLEKSKTWASLRKNIKIISHSDSNTFEIYCLSETPIMAQAVCEKLSYNLTLEVLEKEKQILIDNIELYNKDPSLLRSGETLKTYERKLKELIGSLKHLLEALSLLSYLKHRLTIKQQTCLYLFTQRYFYLCYF